MACPQRPSPRPYRRRRPEQGLLHRILREHLATFLARADACDGRGLPRFVRRELLRYLACGVLAFGFARVHCSRCGRDDLVAFACKGRGFCPSCGARRMADTAAHLVDAVLPRVPVRQWVLSFPHRVRYLLAYDPRLCAAVRRIFVSVVLGWLEARAERQGIPRARAGAVVFTQRFGSALNSNLHFHALVTDGVFTCPSPFTRAFFRPARRWKTSKSRSSPAGSTVASPATSSAPATCRATPTATGRPRTSPTSPCWPSSAPPRSRAASPWDATAAAPSPGSAAAGRSSRSPSPTSCAVTSTASRCTPRSSSRPSERERLEHLCRYVARPPLSTERLSLAPDGKVVYRLRRHWRDGTAAVAFDPLTFIERLAALVPRPRCHQLTYHGVLAPAARLRDLVVPRGRAATPGTTPHPSIPRLPWAELLKRVFAIDALTCPWCGGSRKLIALLTDGLVVRQILAHLDLPTEPPPLAPARAPPEPAFDW